MSDYSYWLSAPSYFIRHLINPVKNKKSPVDTRKVRIMQFYFAFSATLREISYTCSPPKSPHYLSLCPSSRPLREPPFYTYSSPKTPHYFIEGEQTKCLKNSCLTQEKSASFVSMLSERNPSLYLFTPKKSALSEYGANFPFLKKVKSIHTITIFPFPALFLDIKFIIFRIFGLYGNIFIS